MALTDNLAAYWKFDESSGDAADSSGNANTATNKNSATFTTGKINNCASLVHASTQWFEAASSASLNFTGDFTVSGWFDFTVTNAEYVMFSRGWDNGAAGHNYWFLYDGVSALSGFISNGSTEHNGTVSWTPSSTTWYYLSMVYTASAGSISFYVNGSQQGTTQTGYPTTLNNTSKQTVIGNLLSSTGVDEGISFGGLIDECGVWSRALSGSEIASLYNAGAGLSYPFGVTASSSKLALLGVG